MTLSILFYKYIFFQQQRDREREKSYMCTFFFFCHKEPAQIFSSHKLFWLTFGSFSIKSKFNEQRGSLASSSPKSETKVKAAFQSSRLTETQDPAAREHKLTLGNTFLSRNVWVGKPLLLYYLIRGYSLEISDSFNAGIFVKSWSIICA